MGVVNVTDDSFSDGGLFLDRDRAVAHGLALASEGSPFDESGHEVTTAPSDADQSETVRIVTEAVTTGSPSREPSDEDDADAGHEPNTLRSPLTEPDAADPAVERDSEMHQP